MMILGELTDYLQPETLKFEIAGVQYEAAPTARDMLDFLTAQAKNREADQGAMLTLTNVYQMTATLLGATYDVEKDVLQGGVVAEMVANNCPVGAITRIVETTYLFYGVTPKAAEVYYQTGSWEAVQDALGLGDSAPKLQTMVQES